jgi:hypothetical protein
MDILEPRVGKAGEIRLSYRNMLTVPDRKCPYEDEAMLSA